MHETFPLDLWDELLPQVNLCLNILRPFPPSPQISAYEGIHGHKYDFSAHPIAPCGTRVLIHDAADNRHSWAPHGSKGFYLGPALEHYRAFRVFASLTHSVRVSDTLAWFPSPFQMPGSSTIELVHASIQDLTSALTILAADGNLSSHSRQPYERLIATGTNALREATALYLGSMEPITCGEQRVLADQLRPPEPASPPTHTPDVPSCEQHIIQPPAQRVPANAPDESGTEGSAAHATLNLAPDGSPLTFNSAKRGPNAAHWFIAEGEEISRLIDSHTARPIFQQEQPLDRRKDTTYYNPQPKEKAAADGSTTYRIRGTAGGDRINYPGEVAAKTAELEVVKLLIQSAASDRATEVGGKMLSIDISDFYLGAPLERPEYVRIPLKFIPDGILKRYKLSKYIHRGAILFEILKCMYGLPQSGLLSQRRLIAHLAKHGYEQTPNVPCLFKHKTRHVVFTLVVDDFAVKYKEEADAAHLIATLEELYKIKVDRSFRKYLGYTIKFDDAAHTVALSIPDYIPKLLQRFFPNQVIRGAASPAVYVPPHYGASVQEATADETPPLSPAETTLLQEQIGSLLFYARAVDCTMLTATNHASSEQAKPTQRVLNMVKRVLQYAAAHPNHELVYRACDMQLRIQSDASYLSRSDARSVAGGLFYCGNCDDTRTLNGPLLAVSSIIPTVCASVAEAEYAACFMNGQHGTWLRTILAALGYPQRTATPMLCDNKCAVGIATNSMKAKRSKAIDMRYHWIRDRISQGEFNVLWIQGADNIADFFTKALPVHRHQQLKRVLVNCPPSPNNPSLTSRARNSHAYRATQSNPGIQPQYGIHTSYTAKPLMKRV